MNTPLNFVLLGRPGSGKGTQAEILSEKLSIPHISSGDIFRKNMQDKTSLGISSQKYMDTGQLVPDELLLEMMEERMAKSDLNNGYILDGTPRTLNQGVELQKMFSKINRGILKVINIDISRELMVQRLSGRWTCKTSGHSYHEIFKPPKNTGVCDIDGSELYQREDQKPEAIKVRIEKYENDTMPLIDFYSNLGLLLQINGDQSIEEVSQEIITKLHL